MTNVSLSDEELDVVISSLTSRGEQATEPLLSRLLHERGERISRATIRKALGDFFYRAGMSTSQQGPAVDWAMDNEGLGGVREAITFWHRNLQS